MTSARRIIGTVVLAVGLGSAVAAPSAAQSQDGVETVSNVRVALEVVSVNLDAGRVVLRNLETGAETARAPGGGLPDVLDLRPGARLSAVTTRAVSAYPASDDAPLSAPRIDGFSVPAEREGKPALVIGRLTSEVVELVAWDAASRRATARRFDDSETSYAVRDPAAQAFLNDHSPGERFVVDVSETTVLIREPD
ncbi:MAG: hypothetical protein AAFU61_16065 [Pseudomonadota bacterium]